MIPLIEDYLVDLVSTKLQDLRDNPTKVEDIIRTKPDRMVRLKGYISNNAIKVIKGYPRTAAELPAVCILLSSEEETEITPGEELDDDDWNIQEATETVSVISIENGLCPEPYFQLSHIPIVDIQGPIVNNTTGKKIYPNKYKLVRPNTGLTTLYDGGSSDGDSVTVTYLYRKTGAEMCTVLYESDYRVEVWTANGDLTVDLYHLVKWAFLCGRGNLITNLGLFRQKLGGADFEPAPNYFPDFVYRRALSFWCQFEASVPLEEYPYISDVTVNETISFDRS